MLPTLKNGEDVLVFCWFYKPKIGDIVVIKVKGKEMVKRVQKVTQSVIPAKAIGSEAQARRAGVQLKVFVTGDNKDESTDSRHFGAVNLDQVIGKVIWY